MKLMFSRNVFKLEIQIIQKRVLKYYGKTFDVITATNAIFFTNGIRENIHKNLQIIRMHALCINILPIFM